jgi:peptidoglycan/xylan/chitin deacetylase (PgdA/CDA1 family)
MPSRSTVWTSSWSWGAITKFNLSPGWQRAARRAVLLLVLAAAVIVVRRWVHHAELESVPVIVPSNVPAQAIVHPPAAAIARRMLREVRETLFPPRRPRLAVLTFDDGPYPVETPLLLAQLQALHVPAVFFVIGHDVRRQPAIAARARLAHVELGNHTATHPEMAALPLGEQQAEIAQGARDIEAVTGVRVRYFRPPHGNYDAATIVAARAEGERMALWDIDPGDWRTIPSPQIVAHVIAHARSPAVILLHNGKLATIEALPDIVAAYRAAGFRFVTLSQLQARLPLSEINDPLPVRLPVRAVTAASAQEGEP